MGDADAGIRIGRRTAVYLYTAAAAPRVQLWHARWALRLYFRNFRFQLVSMTLQDGTAGLHRMGRSAHPWLRTRLVTQFAHKLGQSTVL